MLVCYLLFVSVLPLFIHPGRNSRLLGLLFYFLAGIVLVGLNGPQHPLRLLAGPLRLGRRRLLLVLIVLIVRVMPNL